MKKLMQQSSENCESSHSIEHIQSSPGELLNTPERTHTELGEQIKVEFKKALANRRPSST